MSENNIEILGQKLSYPTTWHGTTAVLFLCIALVIIALLFKGWATPDTINAVKGLYADASVQDEVNQQLLKKIKLLTERINTLESNKNGITSAEKTLQNQEFSKLNTLFSTKTVTRFKAAPEEYKAEILSPEQIKKLMNPDKLHQLQKK